MSEELKQLRRLVDNLCLARNPPQGTVAYKLYKVADSELFAHGKKVKELREGTFKNESKIREITEVLEDCDDIREQVLAALKKTGRA